MRLNLIVLMWLLAAIGCVYSLSDNEYCKLKLGCINWKKEYKRCHKSCMGNSVSPKQGEMFGFMESFVRKYFSKQKNNPLKN
jgi:hypothetical protein